MTDHQRGRLEKLLTDLIPLIDKWRYWSEETVPEQRAKALRDIAVLLEGYAMHDILSIYRDSSQEWRWRRKTPGGGSVAESGQSYKRRVDCDRVALRVNAQPYVVEVEGEIIVEIDTSQEIPHEEESIGRATFGGESEVDRGSSGDGA